MVQFEYTCGDCQKTEKVLVLRKTKPLFKSKQRFMREGGFCTHKWPTVEDMLPEGWAICHIGAVYCGECWARICGVEEGER